MSVAALETKRGQLVDEANALLAKQDRSEDEEKRIVEMIAEAKTLREQIAKERELETLAGEKSQYDQPARRLGAQRGVEGAEPNGETPKPRDRRSIGRQFVRSDAFKNIQRGLYGRGNAVHFDGLLAKASADDDIEERTLVTSGTPADSMLLPQVLAQIYRPAEAPLTLRDVLAAMRTDRDSITVISETSFTNNAAEVAEATATNGTGLTGGVKPESALDLGEASFPVRIIAHYIPVTRQTIEDLPAMEAYINDRLITGLKRRENAEFLNGNGTAPNLTGLLTTSGIQALDATYFTANPVAGAAADRENLDRILRGIQKIMWTGFANPTFVLMNPADYEAILTVANTQGNYLFGGPAGGRQPTLWGLPVVQEPELAAGTVLVGDGTMAAVADRTDAQIYVTDSHSDWFIRNILAILAEERVALPVFRPVAFALVTLA